LRHLYEYCLILVKNVNEITAPLGNLDAEAKHRAGVGSNNTGERPTEKSGKNISLPLFSLWRSF
jgi:hypothetical protein